LLGVLKWAAWNGETDRLIDYSVRHLRSYWHTGMPPRDSLSEHRAYFTLAPGAGRDLAALAATSPRWPRPRRAGRDLAALAATSPRWPRPRRAGRDLAAPVARVY